MPLRGARSLLDEFASEVLHDLCEVRSLPRCGANWTRLVFLAVDFCLPGSGPGLLTAIALRFRDGLFRDPPKALGSPSLTPWLHCDFDQTLGYPGNGPDRVTLEAYESFRTKAGVQHELVLSCLLEDPSFQKLQPKQDGDIYQYFFSMPPDPEFVSSTLGKFGREAFEAGRPYWHYTKTVNTLAGLKPSIRRQLIPSSK